LPKGRHYKITLADVLLAHDNALKSGGAEGFIDSALVESAIGRPYTGYYRSIYKKAAALTHSLCRNHGFTDGNKRTALQVVELFLDHSGYKLVRMPNVELENTFVRVAEGAMEFDALVEWYKNKIQPSD